MAEVHGSVAVLLHNAQDLTDYLKEDIEGSAGDRELHDVTAFNATDDAHMVSPIKQGVPIQLGGIWSTEVHAIIAPLDGETDATVYRPAGTGSGLPSLGGNSTLTGYKVKTPHNAPATWSATLTPQEGFTWSTQ